MRPSADPPGAGTKRGEEPDHRFSLANERTFLAWLRTGLAQLASSVATAQCIQALAPSALSSLLAVLPAVIGTALCALAYRRRRRVQHAMRHRCPLPPSRMPPLTLAAGGECC
ncbi:YidH family protein [Streptomyces sp. NPDC093586]|uniref:YidH family protein n=1 Tax=Streptomyces sp. NPDC093586 TaxID=3366042 RepID=UPI003826F7D9